MATSHPLRGNPDGPALRKQAGAYIAKLRGEAGLTQQQVAKELGADYYTIVSQIENGKTRIAPDQLQLWAEILGVEPREFAKHLLQFYDPYMWKLLFGPLKPIKSTTPKSFASNPLGSGKRALDL